MILSECIQESKRHTKPLLVAALDVQKVFDARFDVVDHDSLLRKQYFDVIFWDDWLLMKKLYTNISANVKWDGVFYPQRSSYARGCGKEGSCPAPTTNDTTTLSLSILKTDSVGSLLEQ